MLVEVQVGRRADAMTDVYTQWLQCTDEMPYALQQSLLRVTAVEVACGKRILCRRADRGYKTV